MVDEVFGDVFVLGSLDLLLKVEKVGEVVHSDELLMLTRMWLSGVRAAECIELCDIRPYSCRSEGEESNKACGTHLDRKGRLYTKTNVYARILPGRVLSGQKWICVVQGLRLMGYRGEGR